MEGWGWRGARETGGEKVTEPEVRSDVPQSLTDKPPRILNLLKYKQAQFIIRY